MEIKKNIPNNTITRKLVDLDRETGNVYKSINIIARRANQISTELKTELNRKLADFSSPTDKISIGTNSMLPEFLRDPPG